MTALELLAPARTSDIGIAAIDCGADAVYIAGPSFGARKDAGNSVEDIGTVCSHAHLFGARVFVTVNTIIRDEELEDVHSMMLRLQEAGADAFIVQDLALTRFGDITVPLHASTQCSIRTPGRAAALEALGFSRLVMERELSLEEIGAIRKATGAELEAFVHGALCVCYSGECYMSEAVASRSANRGECIQACRSLYDLTDASGKVLVRDKALLSLKDLNLIGRLSDLAAAGVMSFKIEGRLKNASYVKNVVRAYSQALDELVSANPDLYRRASWGHASAPFTPSLEKTFNRGYTQLYIDSERGSWSSMDAPKSMGEQIGTVRSIRGRDRRSMEILLKPAFPGLTLSNGDGFSVVTRRGGIVGFRGDICEGLSIICKPVNGISEGDKVFRNVSAAFEKELEKDVRRELDVTLRVTVSDSFSIGITAVSEDGRTAVSTFNADVETARSRERELSLIREQLSKRAGQYRFTVSSIDVAGDLPLLSTAIINSIRRCIASDLDALPVGKTETASGREGSFRCSGPVSYKANVANSLARRIYSEGGAADITPAYELSHEKGIELMRTRYCIRYELGLCPVRQGAAPTGDLFLRNQGRRFALGFDCSACEMTVKEA